MRGTPIITPGTIELFSEEMQLKIPLLNRGWKFSKFKPGC
jgi:hypothetical protein